MKIVRLLWRRKLDGIFTGKHSSCRCNSTVAQEYTKSQPSNQSIIRRNTAENVRTTVHDPRNHTIDQHGLFYTLPEADMSTFIRGGIPREYQRQIQTFNEACIMVRHPALEIIDILRNVEISNPLYKFLIYGRHGSGKSLTLAHVLHYGAVDGWMLVHLPYPKKWIMYSAEIVPNQWDPSRFDLPLYAMEWLADFKTQNSHLLHNYTTSKKYTWTKRDVTEENSPLSDVVDYGLTRGKFATDVIGVVVKEIKRHASEKRLKTMVAIDIINSMYSKPRLRDARQHLIPVEKVSMIHHFRKLFTPDWNHCVLVATVDRIGNIPERREQFTPKYLLGKEGFSTLDPYIPIGMDDYTEKEMYSCMQYYKDRNWIQTPEGLSDDGFKEFKFISGYNPRLVMETVAPW